MRFGQADVEVKELVPVGVEEAIEETIFVGVFPERNEGVVFLVGCFFIVVVENIVEVKAVELFPELLAHV